MGKSKRAIYWAIMCILLAIITTACGLTIVHSSKVATLTLDQTVTYNAPTNIPVTFLANGGEFSGGGNTINETIKINTLSGTSIFPTNPTRTGYTFAGWEYSVDGTNYSDYASASDMPFTDHLYVRAKWEEVIGYTVTINVDGSTAGLRYQTADFGTTAPTNISSDAGTDIQSGAWTQCASSQVVIQNVQRIFIALGGNEITNIWCTIESCELRTNRGNRIGTYYFDSGDLTGNVSYSTTVNMSMAGGAGGMG